MDAMPTLAHNNDGGILLFGITKGKTNLQELFTMSYWNNKKTHVSYKTAETLLPSEKAKVSTSFPKLHVLRGTVTVKNFENLITRFKNVHDLVQQKCTSCEFNFET